jgi:phenylacetate-coenzyme A ligase PaaK-like adenylate-forming protein
MIHNDMPYDDFPGELSLRFRVHVLCTYAQSTLALMEELAQEGADNLDAETLKIFDSLAEQTERIWFEAAKIRMRVRAI